MVDGFFRQFESEYPESISVVTLSRNGVLIASGQRERFCYLVESGALRVVYQSESQQQNIRFGYAGSAITSLPAFFDESPSLFDIIAIRKSEIKCFEKNALLQFVESTQKNQKLFQYILQDLVRQQIEREIDLLISSPVERYQRVLARSPKLFQEIPAVHIANYLRMTPEHLSRIRKS